MIYEEGALCVGSFSILESLGESETRRALRRALLDSLLLSLQLLQTRQQSVEFSPQL